VALEVLGRKLFTLTFCELLDVIHCVDHIEVLVLLRVEDSQGIFRVVSVILDINMRCCLQILSWLKQDDVSPEEITE
jgi:hypothetical protein